MKHKEHKRSIITQHKDNDLSVETTLLQRVITVSNNRKYCILTISCSIFIITNKPKLSNDLITCHFPLIVKQMSTMFYLFYTRTFDFMFYERRTIKKHKKGEYNGASHSFTAVTVKRLRFAL